MYVDKIFKRYKLTIKDNQILDPIRKKYVALTPEEKVRQQTIKFLIQRLEVPKEKIGVEKSLSSLGDIGNRKRIDICIWGESEEILAIIECKAGNIDGWEAPYQQAIDYVESLKVRNYFVVDGWIMDGYHYDYDRIQFDPIDEIPTYQEMLRLK